MDGGAVRHDDLTVVCVLSEPLPGQPVSYTFEHVERLREQVAQHLDRPYEFVVLDDSDRLGWWAKLDLFQPGRFSGRVLYLDLDVVIVGSLDVFVDFDVDFAAPRDPLYLGFNSSIMVWDADASGLESIPYGPPLDWRQWAHGDQRWIHHCVMVNVRGVRFLPARWCESYKRGLYTGYWPGDLRVVYFHGRPKPWEVEGPMPWEAE